MPPTLFFLLHCARDLRSVALDSRFPTSLKLAIIAFQCYAPFWWVSGIFLFCFHTS